MERGENGTDHLQYFVQFQNKIRIGTVKAFCKFTNWQPVIINNGAHTYCMKEATR